MHLGISTGGHYRSEDGGKTFAASNQGVGAGYVSDPYPEFGQCVHKIARHPDAPGRLYMQNHGGWEDRPGIGVLRSDDGGQTWRSIAKGLPTDFRFPIVVHPHDPDVVYVVPLEPMTRTCPGAVPAVWRSENGGSSWKRLVKGLPKKDSYFTILWDAMTTNSAKRPLCTLAQQQASYGSVMMAAKNGVACSTHFHPFIVLRPQWFDFRISPLNRRP